MNNKEAPPLLPGQKIEEEAHQINEKVDRYYGQPRTDKSRSADDVAHQLIKKERSALLDLSRMTNEERQWYENMRSSGIRVLNDGFIEIPRWEKGEKHAENPMRVRQKIDGVNSAIRMQYNILDAYRSEGKNRADEFSKLESIQEVIEQANGLLISWPLASPEEKKLLQARLAGVVLQLEHCRNEFKAAARGQSDKVRELKDSLGRENPGALAARTVAALNSLAKRINEMRLIAPVIALRKEMLVLEKRRAIGAISRSAAYITGIKRHSVFRKHPAKTPESRINDNEISILDNQIGKALHLLDRIHVLPYSKKAEQAKFYLINTVKKYFSSKKQLLDNLSSAEQALEEAIGILKSDIERLG